MISDEIATEIKEDVKNILDYKRKVKINLSRRVTQLIEIILLGAFYLEASDIHIEPREKITMLRIRVDGVLHDALSFSKIFHRPLVSRLKVLSSLKLNITKKPQDGRFSLLIPKEKPSRFVKTKRGYYSVEIRTSSLPAEHGESVVLRILNPKWVVSMEELGLRKDHLEIFETEVRRPNGMIICTGPTGCGKTTTLYAFLQEINRPEIKIITLEDPIEYHLKGVSQTQVDEERGYTFANGLRAVVRQDPDIIFIGEIRDLETSGIALQAALTGHLVFSTVHTNDAAGTIARLQALGEKVVNIAPAINMAIGQRLVRKVCEKCVKLEPISPKILEKLKKELKDFPKIAEVPKLSRTLKIPQPGGCKECNFTGYRGRIGIFESFLVDDEMEQFISQSPSISAMRKEAVRRGMTLMRQDGFFKVLKGITTIEEVEQVTGVVAS